jgi:hypothetical protein
MLAASDLSSNVPPDDLQVTPVPALLAICADQFRDHRPGDCLDTQPTHRAQQDTAGNELRRMPLDIGPEDLDLAISNKPQRDAAGPGAAQENQFPYGREAPQSHAKDTQGDSQWQENNQEIAGQ